MNHSKHVIFGTGPLGTAVMHTLAAKGETVYMVNRSGKADVPSGVSVTAANVYDRDSARQVCQDAAVVYQCAAPPYHEWLEKFPLLQTNILEAAAHAGGQTRHRRQPVHVR